MKQESRTDPTCYDEGEQKRVPMFSNAATRKEEYLPGATI
jgi:hypothetical protein